MVQQSTLLRIIQFVGLLAPALAILIELLIRFHGGLDALKKEKSIPVEIQVLLFAFITILLGGMAVGLQMTLTLDNQLTQLASLLIFGGLPFLAMSVLVVSLRISVDSPSDAGFIEETITYIKYSISLGLPLILSPTVYFGTVYLLRDSLNSQFDWWIFANELDPAWYFYIAAGVISYNIIYSLWKYEYIPSNYIPGIIETWLDAALVNTMLFLMFFVPSFGLYYVLLLLEIPFFTPTSIISAVPYLITSFAILIVFLMDEDPKL